MGTVDHAADESAGEERFEQLPGRVQEALGELAGAAKEGLLALSVGVGLGVLAELMAEEVEDVVGPKGKHDRERSAVRHGHEGGEVTLGGRRVGVERPRVRATDGSGEVALSTYRHFADRDPLTALVLEQMLAGVSTRRFSRTREPVGRAVVDAELKAAIAEVLGCSWQRCIVHFLRDCLGHARKDQHGLLAALIRPIFNAEDLAQARDRLSEAVAHLDGRLAKVATMLEDAEADILAFYAFPSSHRRKLRSTNPLERFNKEIGRRTDVVGIFPDHRSLIRLAGMLCIEQNDEWLVGRGYLSAESISLVLAGPDDHTHKEKEEVGQLQAA